MSVTLTMDPAASRVRINATGLAAADYATVERSTNLVSWRTVRGGTNVALTAGAFSALLDDYEFVPGVVNTYRVRGIETGAITFVAAGTAATGNNASVVPAHPAGLVEGDLKVILASIRNSGTGTVNVPAGWTLMRAFGNVSLLGRRHVSGDVAPTVTFAGGVANADTIAQMAAWRRAELVPVTGIDQLNASAQNIAYPALTVPLNNLLILFAGWKQDDWTSVATLAGATEIGETSTITGDDAAQVWDFFIQTTKANIVAASFTVTGGAAAISRGAVIALAHAAYLNEQTQTITPSLDRIWLKSPTRPFLNRPVNMVGPPSDTVRPARGGAADVVNRSFPVAQTDLRGSRRWTATIHVDNAADAQTIDYILASGDVLFIHNPPGCGLPGGYVRVVDTGARRPDGLVHTDSRVFTLPCVEVAPPGPDVSGVTSTWDTVLANYATWDAVLAAFPTWDDLLALVGDPSEVIVP